MEYEIKKLSDIEKKSLGTADNFGLYHHIFGKDQILISTWESKNDAEKNTFFKEIIK